jgi:hypothetical protein
MCIRAFAFPVLPFSSQSGKVYEKKQEKKKKHVYDGKIEKIHITFFFLTLYPTRPLHIVKDVVKHHFMHLSRHPSVPSWSVYSD